MDLYFLTVLKIPDHKVSTFLSHHVPHLFGTQTGVSDECAKFQETGPDTDTAAAVSGTAESMLRACLSRLCKAWTTRCESSGFRFEIIKCSPEIHTTKITFISINAINKMFQECRHDANYLTCKQITQKETSILCRQQLQHPLSKCLRHTFPGLFELHSTQKWDT